MAGLQLIAAALPATCEHLTDGKRIVYAAHPDQRVIGTRIFLALASAAIGVDQMEHTPLRVWALAGRLAAPPLLMRRVGLEETVARQRWATRAFLEAWWAMLFDAQENVQRTI